MTREEIDAMPVGREMDEAVARLVMRWRDWKSPCAKLLDPPDCWETNDEASPTFRKSGWLPSVETALAWRVIQTLVARHPHPPEDNSVALAFCQCVNGPLWECHFGWRRGGPSGSGETAPLAVCRAAMLDALTPPPA